MVRPSTDFARMVFFCTFAGKTKIHDSKGSYNKGFRNAWRQSATEGYLPLGDRDWRLQQKPEYEGYDT